MHKLCVSDKKVKNYPLGVILKSYFISKLSFELQKINFVWLTLSDRTKQYAPIIQSRDMYITIFRYDGVALNNENTKNVILARLISRAS